MPLKTLCGIFDEPIKPPKKNFIRENIKSIKQLQEILHEAQKSKENSKTSIERNNRKSRSPSLERRKSISKPDLSTHHKEVEPIKNNKSIEKTLQAINRTQNLSRLKNFKPRSTVSNRNKPQCSDRSVQTDSDIMDSCGNREEYNKETPIEINKQESSKNEIKNNVDFEGGFHQVSDADKKSTPILEPIHPTGHVLLPEKERAETLKTLNEKYQKLIFNLNSLSITCDTLRIRNRRMKLEDELREVDEAIKVFDRPKVYIKR